MIIEILIWSSFLIICHAWVLYPLFMLVYGYFACEHQDIEIGMLKMPDLPSVTVIMPIYISSGQVDNKIKNIKKLDYPPELLNIILVLDGSPDDTIAEVRLMEENLQDSKLSVIYLRKNSGKSAAQNIAIDRASGEIILFTDLDAEIDKLALRNAVPLFTKGKIAFVGLNVKFRNPDWDESGSQSLYGKLENGVRKAEAKLGVLTSVFGSAFLVKRKYFKKLDEDTGDDFIIPLDLSLDGHRIDFCPSAFVYDDYSSRGYKSEIRYRQRVLIRNLLGLMRRKELLNPFKYGLLSFAIISHKLLRWFVPLFLLVFFIGTCLLYSDNNLYRSLCILQILFYLAAGVGVILNNAGVSIKLLGFIASFVIGNIGLFWGLISFVFGYRFKAYRS